MTEKNTKVKTSADEAKTTADLIWEEIRALKIEMFALPDQEVQHYCKPVSVDPSKLFLLTTAGSVLPALEAVVSPKYVVDKQERFLVVSLSSAKK
jgi:hypothetical protein